MSLNTRLERSPARTDRVGAIGSSLPEGLAEAATVAAAAAAAAAAASLPPPISLTCFFVAPRRRPALPRGLFPVESSSSSSSSKRRDDGDAEVPSTELKRVDEEVEASLSASFSACRRFRLLELVDEEFGVDSTAEGSSSAQDDDFEAIFFKDLRQSFGR